MYTYDDHSLDEVGEVMVGGGGSLFGLYCLGELNC